jgi:hypothetical protein
MKTPLNTYQRSFAQNRVVFSADLLSQDIAESLRRASLACAENQKKETGIIEFFCSLYLQGPDEITLHFNGDFAAVVSQNFPIHRFGPEGLIPKALVDQMSPEAGSAGAFSWWLNYSDDVLRLLWLSAKLANAVGKKASLNDVIAAVATDRGWMDELLRSGLTPSRNVADFGKEVRTVIFHATPHTGKGWPREMDFELDETLRPPFTLEVSTPSGPFQPVHSARVKLNGSEVADVSWPAKPTSIVGVKLQTLNKIEIELHGPKFSSVELTVRGIPA